jgi:hypothetical protein
MTSEEFKNFMNVDVYENFKQHSDKYPLTRLETEVFWEGLRTFTMPQAIAGLKGVKAGERPGIRPTCKSLVDAIRSRTGGPRDEPSQRPLREIGDRELCASCGATRACWSSHDQMTNTLFHLCEDCMKQPCRTDFLKKVRRAEV